MVLGLGISLGGFWAYETLGWGGWWGWDPVENSSLIPWLISVATVHTMLTQKRTKGLILTNFILATLAFVLVLYSTFLTRSGVLGEASVHSFVDPGRFAFTLLVLFMFMFTDVSLALIFSRFTKWGASIWEKYSGWKLLAVLYIIVIVPSVPIFAQIGGDVTSVFQEAIDGGPALAGIVLYPLLGVAHLLNVLSYLWIPALVLKVGLIVYTLTGRFHSDKEFKSFAFLSRETFLGLGSALIAGLTLVVLLGTSLPIIPKPIIAGVNDVLASVGSNQTLGNTVEPSFYNSMGLPLAILIGLLNAVALLLKWKTNQGKDLLRKLPWSLGFALLFTIALSIFGSVTNAGMLLLGFFSAFAFYVNAEVGYKILRGNPRFTGAYISHIGISFIFLGIIGSGYYGIDKPLQLPMGVKQAAFGYNFTYIGVEPFWNNTRYYFKVRMTDDEGKEIRTVNTIMFVSNYGGQEQVMRNPGIARFFEKDIYLEPQGLTQPDPEGGEQRQFTKGSTVDFGGYKVTFTDFDMNNRRGSGEFTVGAMFKVEKYGKPAEEFIVKKTTGPEGDQHVPAITKAGDLEIKVLELQPNPEQLDQSVIVARLRNPKVPVDPNNMRETLTVMASVKPFINLVWAGIILMVVGFGVARARRASEAKNMEAVARPGLDPASIVRPGATALEDRPVTESVQAQEEKV